MRIGIIGTGYVGLPTGIGFAELGNKVICCDKIKEKIDDLNNKKITLFEEGLEELFNKNFNKNISFTTSIKDCVEESEIIIIAVGTPPHPVTKQADMKYIYACAEEIAKYLNEYKIIAVKSTIPVGQGDNIEKIIESRTRIKFDLISLPEFLREGFAVYDFFNPDRIICGTNNEEVKSRIRELYKDFKTEILFTSRRSSELIKYTSNAFLSMKIHYINEIANLCEKVDANIDEVAKGIGLDTRIGNRFLVPGPGYGGSCFPKDTNALAYIAKQNNVVLSLVEATIKGNDNRVVDMANKIINKLKDVRSPTIAVLGLAFKNGTDDCRKSPAIDIVNYLLEFYKKENKKITINVFDPKANDNAKLILGEQVNYFDDFDVVKNADLLTILTEWKEFKNIDLIKTKSLMKGNIIVDLRNILNKDEVLKNGFEYSCVGKL